MHIGGALEKEYGGDPVPGMDSQAIADVDALDKEIEAGRISLQTDEEPAKSAASTSSCIDDGEQPLSRAASRKDEEAGPIPGAEFRPGEGFPDGGWKAWSCVAGGWLTLFCAFGFMNAIGVFQAYYKSVLLPSYPSSTLSWISGAQLFFIFAGGTFCGPIFDIYGPRGLITAAAFIMPFGVMMISISSEYWQLFLAQAVVVGMGTCMAFYAAINSVSTWFFHRRAFAIGITTTGGSCGGIFFPLVMAQVLPKIGFGWTVRIIGFTQLAFLVCATFLIRSRLNHPKTIKGRKIVFFDFAAFKDPAWAWFTAGCFIQLLGLWAPINYLASYAIAHRFSTSMAFNLLAFLNAGSFFGRIIPGILGDKFGRFTTFVLFSSLSGFLILAVWSQVENHAGVIAFAILYGISSGAFLSMYPACVAQISPIEKIGLRLGTLNFTASIGSIISLPISGALVHGTNFSTLIYFAGAFMLAGGAILTVARWYAAKKRWLVIV